MSSDWNVTPQDDILGVTPGQVVLDRYELFEPCGFGGTASVWRAWVKGTEQEVAVKVQTIGPMTGAHRPERLEREYQILQQMASPHVVGVQDFGYLPDGRAVLVFEFLNGRTLGDLLEDHPTLELRDALDVTAQLLQALARVHEAGVVHRDVKPENIMLIDAPGGRSLKLFDFGIAKVTQRNSNLARAYEGDELAGLFRSLTSAEMTVGTPEYMAPEQISATDLGAFTDVYAVGIVLHEILFGEVPYSGETFFEIAHRHLSGVLPPLPAELPEIVQKIIWTSLARRHQERYQDAAHMLRDVEEALRHPDVKLYGQDLVHEEVFEMHELGVVSLASADAYQRTPKELQALELDSKDDNVAPWGTSLEPQSLPPHAPWSLDPSSSPVALHSLASIDIPVPPPGTQAPPPWSLSPDTNQPPRISLEAPQVGPLARSSTPLSLALAQEAEQQPPEPDIEPEVEQEILGAEDEGGEESAKWARKGTDLWHRGFLES